VKESFNEVTSNNKIVIRINDKCPSYWGFVFLNGDFIVEHKKSVTNIHATAGIDLSEVIPTTGLPLQVRMNLSAKRPDLDSSLESIAQTTGTADWSFEADFEAIIPKFGGRVHELGEYYYTQVMGNVAEMLKKKLTNEMIKEAFNEATSERKIVLEPDQKNCGWILGHRL